MEVLLILTYAALAYAAFKIFNIPVNKWTVPTAVLGGIFMIVFILLMMNYNHPYTKEARFYFFTTPIYSYVRGYVVDVEAQPNVPLKKGDVLFRVDPRPFEYIVQQKQAALAEAEQATKQLVASATEADTDLKRMTAQVALAQQDYDRQKQLYATGVVAKSVVDVASRNLEVSVQSLQGATAAADRAHLAADAEIGGINTTVARIQAELQSAQFDVDQATVRAPTDGYVTQLFLRPGMLAIPAPFRPLLIFVHSEASAFGAAFQQNSLQRVTPGAEAEIAFDAIPGRVFEGHVDSVSAPVASGQLQTSGDLVNPDDRQDPGRSIAIIKINDDLSEFNLPAGAVGQVAVYTHHWEMFAIIRRILLRMQSWLNFVFTEGH